MRIGAWTYRADLEPNAPIPPTWYRGYVESYTGARRTREPCTEVRKTKGEALRDAQKLLKSLTK